MTEKFFFCFEIRGESPPNGWEERGVTDKPMTEEKAKAYAKEFGLKISNKIPLDQETWK